MKKTLGVLLVAPFAVAILAFGAIVILENTVPVDISGIRWDYRENEGFQVREEGYLLEAEPIYDPAGRPNARRSPMPGIPSTSRP